VFIVVGNLLFLAALFISERTLNAHWERLGATQARSPDVVATAIATLGGLLLFGSLFLPWLGDTGEESVSPWELFSHLDILLALLSLGIVVLAVVGLLANDRTPFFIVVVMAAIAVGLTVPDGGEFVRFGYYLAPIGPVVAGLGALVAMSSSERNVSSAGPIGPVRL
jgi:hypothetical protein